MHVSFLPFPGQIKLGENIISAYYQRDGTGYPRVLVLYAPCVI